MTASFPSSQSPAPSRTSNRLPILVVGTVVVFALLIAGMTFLGLAIAFPIALPVAERYSIPVKASDVEIARQFAPFWWVFAVASVASFFGAVVTIVKLIGRVDPPITD